MKHKPTELPRIDDIEDPVVRTYAKELNELMNRAMRNIYDDLKNLDNTEVVSSLPAASKENRGKRYLVSGAGADTLYICIDTGGGGYTFKQIALT